jgi:hypothetical protein
VSQTSVKNTEYVLAGYTVPAKQSLEMEEETDWGQILCSDQQSYIKIENL